MKTTKLFMLIALCVIIIPLALFNCSQDAGHSHGEGEGEHVHAEAGEGTQAEAGEHSHGEEGEHSHGEEGEHSHGEEGEHGGEGHGEEGEESGTRYTKGDTCEETRKGVLLTLKYDAASSSFVGTTKNTSDETVKRVRVEVHLSNGVELGPTKAIDLAPGKEVEVKLSAEGQSFEWWSSHAESGSSEH